jgi:hypothetical protein
MRRTLPDGSTAVLGKEVGAYYSPEVVAFVSKGEGNQAVYDVVRRNGPRDWVVNFGIAGGQGFPVMSKRYRTRREALAVLGLA